ncbi:flagellar hook-basal body complex protein FliE [Buchnera aphidicola]|uniref:flagellar hook-basal body complex protein FliE n=1 Tax=Buchnera aphidicola TaxID=9 RepID=UPI0031B6BE27
MKKISKELPIYFKNIIQKKNNKISNFYPNKPFQNYLEQNIKKNSFKKDNIINNFQKKNIKNYEIENQGQFFELNQKGLWIKILVQLRNKIISSYQELMNLPL